MKLLLDSCVWNKARLELETAGHDVICASDWDRDPGDSEIMAQAYREGRILVTLDKDFGELAIVKRFKHAGIIRLVDFSAQQQAQACLRVLKSYGEEVQSGAIVTVNAEHIRIRPPETE